MGIWCICCETSAPSFVYVYFSMGNVISLLEDLMGLEKPISFREFVTGEDYCNSPDMYEYWLEHELEIPKDCSELILSGSLGGGKSWFAAYYVAYRVYCMLLQGTPQSQLNLADKSDVFIIYFSVSLTMAKRSGYNYLYDVFFGCKWFTSRYQLNKNLKSVIEFTDIHFYIVPASDFGHQIGLNVWAFILDEANFRGPGVGTGVEEQYEEVTQLYDQLQDRQLSRFAMPDGSVNALAVLISSASYQSAFAAKRIEAVRGKKHAHVIISTAYETKPDSFAKETFEVFIGAGVVDPCIVTSEDHKNKLLQQAGIYGTGEESTFFRKVPVNLKPSFEKHLPLALQNHCGVATNISTSFMTNLTFLYKSYVTEEEILPIFQSEYLEASTADDINLIDYLLPDNIRYPERPHSLFLDLSIKNDKGSLVCTRYDGEFDGIDIHTKVFALKIIPPPFPYKTKISKVQRFPMDLSNYLNIVAFGSDQYQSAELRQEVNAELGLEDIRISIDSSDVPHMFWVRGLVEGKIRQLPDKLLEQEVKEAIHDWKKHRVLKAQHSSDDCMQATVGSYYLSGTIGKNSGFLDQLYPEGDINLVGARALERFLVASGYKRN